MQIRTLTGSTIAEALSEARSIWGDAVVMLQAEPPNASAPARISVSVPDAGTTGQGNVDVLVAEPPPSARPLTPAPGAMRRSDRGTGILLEGDAPALRPTARAFDPAPSGRRQVQSAIGFFEHISRQGDSLAVSPEEDTPPEIRPSESHVSTGIDERFALLVSRGLRPSRAKRLCRDVPAGDPSALIQALALQLPPACSGPTPGRIVFLGEAGCGKTSLVLRSALSRVRAGRTAPTIVVVAPDRQDLRFWQDPTSLLESFGLSVVRCSSDALRSALAGIPGDVLVDAPAGFRIPEGVSLHRRLVVDARSSAPATAREGSQADSVILTHLDRSACWGHAAERLIAMDLPVAAMISSARADQGALPYTPSRFADGLCHA